jgi:DNA polymerase-3 subunit alpha
VINKKTLEALVMSGAMDDFGKRSVLFEGIGDMIRFCKKDEKQKETNQIGLFDASDDFEDTLKLEDKEEFSFEEKLAGEKEMIGFYISGHPLDGLQRYCMRRSNNVKKLKMSIVDLLEEDKKKHPEKYDPLPSLLAEGEENELLSPSGGKVGIDGKKEKKPPREEEIVQAV